MEKEPDLVRVFEKAPGAVGLDSLPLWSCQ